MPTTTLDLATDRPDPTVTGHRALLDGRALLRWIPTFLGFPMAGLAARAVAGNIDRPSSAAIGGLAAGAVLGAVQSLGAPSRTAPRTRWMLATALGMAVGLTAGSWIVDFDTGTSSLVVMGAITGAGIGSAQAAVMVGSNRRRATWALVSPGLWAAGWWITAMVIVDAGRQHANFGASGALFVTLASGVVLAARPGRRPRP